MAVMTPFFDIVAGVAILAGRSSLLDTKVFKTGGSNFTLRHLLGLGFVGYGGWHLWKVEQAQDKLKESLEAESFAASAKIKVCGNCGTKEGQEWGDFDEDSYDEWGDCRWCAWGVDPEDQKTIGLCDDCDGVWTDVDVRVEYTEHGESCSNPKCAGYERMQEAESFGAEGSSDPYVKYEITNLDNWETMTIKLRRNPYIAEGNTFLRVQNLETGETDEAIVLHNTDVPRHSNGIPYYKEGSKEHDDWLKGIVWKVGFEDDDDDWDAESFGAELQGNSYMIINEDDGSQTVIDAYLNDDEGLDISVSDGEDTEYGGINFDKNRLPKGISLSNDTKDWTRHYRLSDLGKDEGHELERWYAESFADEDTALPEHIKTELRDQHGISKGEKSLLKLLRKPKEEKADVSVHHQLPDAAFQKSLGDYDLTQYEESEAESFGVEGDDYETASAIQKIRYWARLGITDKGYGDKGKFQNIVKICDSLLEENNAESFSADSFELETDSGHEVQWDDGSFYMTFKEPIDGYGEANGHWYGGERESPDEILLDVEPAWDEETDDEYDVPSLHIQVSQVEYYGIENHNMSVSPDGVASPELLDAIQEGLAWMVDDHEDKTVVSREYRADDDDERDPPLWRVHFSDTGKAGDNNGYIYGIEMGIVVGEWSNWEDGEWIGETEFQWFKTPEERDALFRDYSQHGGWSRAESFNAPTNYTYWYTLNEDGIGDNYDTFEEAEAAVASSQTPMEIYERRVERLALNPQQDIRVGAESFAAMSEESPIVP
jgi:hypothetical protein